MNTKGIKFLAVLAVLAMAFAAFAVITSDAQQNDATEVTDFAGLKAAIAAGGDVELGEDIAITETLTIPLEVSVKLNLNDHDLTATGSDDMLIIIKVEGELTIDAGEDSDKNTIAVSGTATTGNIKAINAVGNGKVIVNGGTITSTVRAIQLEEKSTLLMNGGSITGAKFGIIAGFGTTEEPKVQINDGSVVSDEVALKLQAKASAILNGGEIVANSESAAVQPTAIAAVNDSRLLIDGAEIESLKEDGWGVAVFGTSEAEFRSGSIEAGDAGFGGNGNTENAVKLTMSGGEIEASLGIYMPGKNTLTITGGKILGTECGVEVRAGTVEISEAEIVCTADKYEVKANGNGSTTTGAAIAVSQHTTKLPISLAIKSGEFDAITALSIANPQENDSDETIAISVDDGSFIGKIVKTDARTTTTLSINGGSYSDLSILEFAKPNKGITFIGSVKLEPKTAPPTINKDVKLKIASGAKIDVVANVETTYALKNNGIINVDKGGILTGSQFIDGTGSIEFDGKDVKPEVIEKTDPAEVTDEIINDIKEKSTAIIEIPATVEEISGAKPIEVGNKEVAFVGNDKPISGLNIIVGSGSSSNGSVSFSGFDTVTGTITTGTGTTAQTISLKDVKGCFTISQGSVIIDGKEVSGEFTVTSGTEIKISGSVDAGDFVVKYSGSTGTAKVTVVSGDDKTFEIKGGSEFIIDDSKITLQIDGTLFGEGSVVSAGNIVINNGGKLLVAGVTEKKTSVDPAPAKYAKITITANSGSEVTGVIHFNNTSSLFVAYSGSEINGVSPLSTLSQFVGKDADNGTWSVVDHVLTLTNYNGTYNFGAFDGMLYCIEDIIPVGSNKITYALPETFGDASFFGDVEDIYTKSEAGSLSVEIDASKASKASIEGGITFGAETGIDIDTVSLEVIIKGSNPLWDAKTIRAIGMVVGDVDNSTINVDVLSAYTATKANVKGVIVAGTPSEINASILTVKSAGIGIEGDMDVKSSSMVSISGKALGFDGDLDVRGASSVVIAGGAELENLDVTQDSILTASDVVLEGALVNDGIINLSGKTVVMLNASIKNNTTFNVEGTMNVFGKVDNIAGVFTNDGTITVFAKEIKETGLSLTMTPAAITPAPTGNVVQISTIVINSASFQNDGSLKINEATVTFKDKTGAGADVGLATGYGKYTGILTTVQNSTTISYTLNLTSIAGLALKSGIVVTFDDSAEVGKKYSVAVSGKVLGIDETTEYTMSRLATPAIGADNINNKIVPIDEVTAKAYIAAEGGKIVNNSTINYYGTLAKTVVGYGAEFVGDLNTGIQTINIDGTFKGDITAIGAVKVTKDTGSADGKVEGDINAKAGVTSSGTIKGDIISEAAVTVKNLEGDVTINRESEEAALSLTVNGKVSGDVIYNTKYYATKSAETKTAYSAVLTLDADLTNTTTKSLVIEMNKGADATDTVPVKPGYFSFGKTDGLATGKKVNVTVTEGTFAFPGDKKLPVRYAMTFEAGSTVEVSAVATADFSDAALKVSKDAKSNFVTGTAPVTDYGLVKCIMSFTVGEGAYTIYSDVAYAIANCEEGSTLTVEAAEAPINDNITVPKNVNVIVSTGSTMSFGTHGLSMSEGAKIIIVGTAKVTFEQTGKAPTTEAIYNVNGTFAFGDNIIVLDKVRFNAYANTIAGIAATASDPAKISLDVSYNDGTLTMSEGTGAGKITLTNTPEKQQKSDAKEKTVFGTFAVAEGAIFDATAAITDAQYEVKYKEVTDGHVVDEIVKMPSIVVVNGTLNLSKGTTATGVYLGAGKIVLADGQSFILASGATKDVGEAKKYAASVTAQIVDSTDDENGYALLLVSNVNDDDATDLIIKADKYKDAKVMTIKGTVDIGAIKATDDAYLNGVIVNKDAGIIGDDVYIIGATTAHGKIGAITMHMKETGSSDYEKLTYEATFEEDGYTVYTDFKNIDFDDVTDITIDGKDVIVDKKLDLSGKDVNIVIAKDYKLVLQANLIIGTPLTVLGDEGSSIVGKVVIDNDLDADPDKFFYIVAYSDVDLTLAEITVSHNGVAAGDAVSSKLIVEENLYATIFAEEDTIKLSKADAAIVPEIVGYNFTAWINYNGDANANVGETNAYADAEATLVFVTVKYVTGVDYYMNGVLFNVYDIPTSVAYGSYFTAKISDTSKYQGNPLINGQKTVCVIDDVELVASGVEPIPEPPQPEPVIGDSGISLTDILLIVLVVLIAIMVVILVLRLNRS